ncbi:hypothetical protein F3Y22_tig00110831pilonHSYRG00009 [Hibiscus syriacus]|uniref:NB-ARC domain-containing protein n=1 Tax=Hibiscus syriacus TaxID=106335 RepID=A0A6A2ZM81_HIBSY|nr:hypothetical protein F3Y22_tig00110831pilonHSYRG00009 [Hibiscus syriacus]
MAALDDDTVSIIGVYGMGGVGKTTLVKEASKRAMEKQLFNEVVFIAVTQTSNTQNLQNEIASQLGLKLDDPSVDVRAARLHQHKGCKILMTSRRLDVLKSMDSEPNFSVETLKQDEAWNLFKKRAGYIVQRSDLQSTAVEVAKRCAGLPIAMATTAKALKPKQNLFERRDALRQLIEELGPIFLLYIIMGHNADMEDLLRYAIGLGFIHDVRTMEESRDRVLTSVNNLKASCLSRKSSHQSHFDMHDVVRDVTQKFSPKLSLFKDWPDEKMNKSQLVSLQNVQGMQRLKVLEFAKTRFTSLPFPLVP